MYLLFSKSTKEVSSVALSKHVPHYGPRSGFRIISWRPLPQSREIPLSDTQESTVQLCRFEPLESLHLYPGKDKYNISIKKIYLYKINMTMFWFWLIIVYILLSHAFTSSLYAPFFEVLYRNFALDFHGLLVWVCIYIDCLSLMCQSIPHITMQGSTKNVMIAPSGTLYLWPSNICEPVICGVQYKIKL